MDKLYTRDKYNLYELIKTELDTKAINWTAKEKIDYIYIRMCQIFNYDERWNYSTDSKLKDDIYDYNINIFNVDITKLVCSTFSKAFSDLVNIFLMDSKNFDMALTEGNINDGHMYTMILYRDGSSSIYDPINTYNDFLNAKVGNKLQGIKMYKNLEDWENDLIQESIYRKIDYIIDFSNKIKTIGSNGIFSDLYGKSLLDKMINTIDISDLGIHEVNNLFNLYSNLLFQRNLRRMGVFLRYDSSENGSRFFYNADGEDKYLEEEIAGQVVFTKIKK